MTTFRLFALAGLAAPLLAACATTAPAPMRGDYTTVTPREANDRDSTGAAVRWGGRIVQVEPRDNRTCFEMTATRLDSNGRPYWASNDPGGRFIACHVGFYDKSVFGINREVTFTGRIDSYDKRRIDGHDYRFPHLTADTVYLWPLRERNPITRPAPWPWWGYW